MKNLSFIFLALLFSSACSQTPYDRSTPEKFVIAIGQAALTFDEYYPIPYFYTKDASEAIQQYDALGAKGKENFDNFKSVAMATFPQYASKGFDNKLRFSLTDGSRSSFSFSATIIGDQIKNRTPEDYAFISSETTEDGIVNITMTIKGNEAVVATRMVDGQLQMSMEEKALTNIKKMTVFLQEASTYYEAWTQEIKEGKVTTENLPEYVLDWETKYMQAIKKMKG